MRIIGGKYKGTRLHTPSSDNTRPTSDRTRESLFNILNHGVKDFDLEGKRVLDLFAGTGALGLEALSRGAAFALFVEDNTSARATIRKNIETIGITGTTKIFRRDATRLGDAKTLGQFDIIFLDPPYNKGLGEKALKSAVAGNWFNDDALCILEEHADADFMLPEYFKIVDLRNYGDTIIRILSYCKK